MTTHPAIIGPSVQWQDDAGGWHTGEIVDEVSRYREEAWWQLVRESCDLRLTWVRRDVLRAWPNRSEWEQA